MSKERFERSEISFPSVCVRCGSSDASRHTQLPLPYRALWRSNPVIKAPVCMRCFLVLGLQEWISLALTLGVSLWISAYLPRYFLVNIIQIDQRRPGLVPAWLTSDWFIEGLVLVVFLGTFYFVAHWRDRFLRRDHLKIKIADYRTDWIELESDDASYFTEFTKHSQVFS
jgi:hypothetical protein